MSSTERTTRKQPQQARDSLRNLLPDVSGTGYAHCLIYIAAAGKRVAYCTAQTGGSASERFDFSRVVVGLVLELEQPFLYPSVHIDVNIDAAGIVFLTDFHVVEQSLRFEVTRSDGGHIHKVETFLRTAEFLTHLQIHSECSVNILFDE